jgi:hypothetical protein
VRPIVEWRLPHSARPELAIEGRRGEKRSLLGGEGTAADQPAA